MLQNEQRSTVGLGLSWVTRVETNEIVKYEEIETANE